MDQNESVDKLKVDVHADYIFVSADYIKDCSFMIFKDVVENLSLKFNSYKF